MKTQDMMIDTDAMIRAQEAELKEAYRRTDAMAIESEFKPINLFKVINSYQK